MTNNALELFRGVVPFVAVAEARSFRGAAARLGVSPAAVSKAVQALEASVGAQLLVRSSRAVALTPEGELFFERSRAAVAAVGGARQALEGGRREPVGELVVSLPFVLTALVAEGLALLTARHPRLRFRLLVTDRLSRLAEESVDVALRVGRLPGTRLVARLLRRTRMVTVAAPSYLARRGTPLRLEDLADHDCLSLTSPTGRPWPFLFRGGPLALPPGPAAIDLDHGPMLLEALVAGLGVGQLFDFMAAEPIRAGLLVQLVPAEEAPGPDVHGVCAPGRRVSPRVRAAFEAFSEAMRGSEIGRDSPPTGERGPRALRPG